MLAGVTLFGGMLGALVAEYWQEGTVRARARLKVDEPLVSNQVLLERVEALVTIVESLKTGQVDSPPTRFGGLLGPANRLFGFRSTKRRK